MMHGPLNIKWTDEVEEDVKKMGIIYWHSVARDWRNGGKCIGRQGPRQTIVIVEDEEELEEEEEEELQYTLMQV
jgi:hypothetical protein